VSKLAIETLMKAYFHQDFREVHGGVWETVDAFVRDNPRNASRVIEEVPELLKSLPTDEQVDYWLDSLGCEYRFENHEGGSRQWLREIASRVQAGLAEQN
jgi:hypothetical protein